MASRDAEQSRDRLVAGSAAVAATVRLVVDREADLIINAAAVIAADPDLSHRDFNRWAASVRALKRYPEVNGFGLVLLVPESQVPAYAARVALDRPGHLGPSDTLSIVPPGKRPMYCLSPLSVDRPQSKTPPGFDFCATEVGSILERDLAARDSGRGSYEPYRVGAQTYLGMETPIYRAGAATTTVAQRRKAFVGWLGMSVDPQVILRNATAGHSGLAVTLEFDDDHSRASFSRGQPTAGSAVAVNELGNGWTVRTSGPVQGASVADNPNAQVVLVGGVVTSLLLSCLVLVLAFSRSRALVLVQRRTTALRNSEERFRSLVQYSSDLIMVSDESGILTWVSPACTEMLGRPAQELTGQHVTELIWPDDRDAIETRLRNVVRGSQPGQPEQPERLEHPEQLEPPERLECRMVQSEKGFRWVEVTVTNLLDTPGVQGLALNVRDVNDRHRLQAQLRQAQKLEAVGQLASGVAHELNTPIQFIGNNLRFVAEAVNELLADWQPAGRSRAAGYEQGDLDLMVEIPSAVEQSLEGVERVARIVEAMKSLGHADGATPSPADLNEAIRATAVMARGEYREVADFAFEPADLPPVVCFRSELSQAFLNLIVNAAHAVADRHTATGQRGRINARTWLQDGHACVSITDTGTGIPAEIAEHVFEPFFTTKPVGQGTGQGLSTVYAIVVQRHGGTIDFSPAPDGGAVFTVRIPLTQRGIPT